MPTQLSDNAFAQWRDRFHELDTSPWPGPRPLRSDDPQPRLVGRDDDADDFTTAVLDHQVVVLTGESGVGKTSIIELGLTPKLRVDGFAPMTCRVWGELSDDVSIEEFIATNVVLPEELEGAPGADLLTELDEVLGDGAVLILDQFEELIRYHPAQFQRMTDWILKITRRHQTRVVLSLRSEYEHRLADMVRQMGPFKLTRMVLRPLTATEVIEQVVTQPNDEDDIKVTAEAAKLIADLWQRRNSNQVGLLHLQALLYGLAAAAGPTPVDVRHVQDLAAEQGQGTWTVADGQGPLFEQSLALAVRLKLDRCIQAAREGGRGRAVDEALIHGTESLIRRMLGQLTSGGYKLDRELWDLAHNVLDRELTQLDIDDVASRFHEVVRTVSGSDVDLLAPNRDLSTPVRRETSPPAREQDLPEEGLSRLGVVPVPWLSDPEDRSSGPMLGMSPDAVVIEEMRRFLFAVQWLVTTSLVRVTTWSNNRTQVSLIHDGFALGLQTWIGDRRVGPDEATLRLTATRGETFDWRTSGPLVTGDDYRYVVNARWISCRIMADIRHVVFVNCDFRGSTFSQCRFEGATFLNCLLDGVTFDSCLVIGPVSDPVRRDAGDEGLPSFMVPVPQPAVQMLNLYRDTEVAADQLLSLTSGVAAVPWGDEAHDAVAWEPQSSGLAMLGGRLASLAVRRCSFAADGEIAFWYVAGTSLELAEQASGTLKIFQSAIRGLSVTPPVDTDEDDQIRVWAEDAKLFGTWLGRGLVGAATIRDCVVIQLFNASDQMKVELTGCGYAGLFNTQSPTSDSQQLDGLGPEGLGKHGMMLEASRVQMDFRSTPARLELLRMMSAEVPG